MSGLYTQLGGQWEAAKTVFYCSMWDEQTVQDIQPMMESGDKDHLEHANNLVFHVFKKVMELMLASDQYRQMTILNQLPVDMRNYIGLMQYHNIDLCRVICDCTQILHTIYTHPWGLKPSLSPHDIPEAKVLFEENGILDQCLSILASENGWNQSGESAVTVALRKACPAFHSQIYNCTYLNKELFERYDDDDLRPQETVLLLLLAIKAAFMAVQEFNPNQFAILARTRSQGWPQDSLKTHFSGIRQFGDKSLSQADIVVEWETRRKIFDQAIRMPPQERSSALGTIGAVVGGFDGSMRSASIMNLVIGGDEVRSSAGLLLRYLLCQPRVF